MIAITPPGIGVDIEPTVVVTPTPYIPPPKPRIFTPRPSPTILPVPRVVVPPPRPIITPVPAVSLDIPTFISTPEPESCFLSSCCLCCSNVTPAY